MLEFDKCIWDASHWQYFCEGNENVVFSFSGCENPHAVCPHILHSKMLRIRKCDKGRGSFQNDEEVRRVIENIIGNKYSPIMNLVPTENLPKTFITELNNNLKCCLNRPKFRTSLLHTDGPVVLMPNYTLLPISISTKLVSVIDEHGFRKKSVRFPFNECTYAVEIKPKRGVPCVNNGPKDMTKTERSRFSMHQDFKIKCGKILEVNRSEYDPFDLFSNERFRIKRAINALIKSPQNNFRLFCNGKIIYDERIKSKSSENVKEFKCMVKNTEINFLKKDLIEVITNVLLKEDIMERILMVQRLDIKGIEVVRMYYDAINQFLKTSTLQYEFDYLYSAAAMNDTLILDKLANVTYNINSSETTLGNALQYVQNYLLAKSFMDISIMLSMKKLSDVQYENIKGDQNIIEIGSHKWIFKIAIIDISAKRHENIPRYDLMAKEIRDNAKM